MTTDARVMEACPYCNRSTACECHKEIDTPAGKAFLRLWPDYAKANHWHNCRDFKKFKAGYEAAMVEMKDKEIEIYADGVIDGINNYANNIKDKTP